MFTSLTARVPRALLFSSALLFGLLPAVAEAMPQTGEQSQQEQERDPQKIEEIVVITASGAEQLLLEAPTAISVVDSADIALSPAQNYADLLRGVPGLNVTQTSARDINMSSRSATSTLDASQLVLIDGRSVYQDFFGFVAWDLLPLDFSEIEQIEVIRGPGSAVWGANAMSGVVNIITKTPRSMGNMFRVRAGGGGQGTGFGSLTYAATRENSSYRVTGAYYTQDPWDRPGPLPSGQPRDIFPNQGTKQPKFDARFDLGDTDDSWWSVMGGYAGTGGTIHTGIGPFSIRDGSSFWYARADYNRRALNVKAYVNVLDGDAINLLNGLPFSFESQTYNIALSNSTPFGGRHFLTYGGNYRSIAFDLSIAPGEDSRGEGGGYVSADLNLTDSLSIDAGVRGDSFSVIDGTVISPRGAVLFNPGGDPNHVLRVSFGRAFRAPSMINNFLDVSLFQAAPLPTGPFIFSSAVFGNPDLVEERLDQFEVGYRGVFADGDIALELAAYRTETKDSIDFYTKSVYTAFNPPAGWPLPTFFLPPFGPILLPSEFSYRNIGEYINKGFEASLRLRPMARNTMVFNYSYQDEPEVTGIAQGEIGIPPTHRFNVGWNGYSNNLYYSTQVSYQDEAFWTDVLDSRFFGFTDSFTTVDASLGYLFLDGTAEVSLRGTNILNEDMQQHVFGDIIGRRVLLEMSLNVR